jgi:tetratricopeptide (TPR) repeat protein
MQVCIHPKSSPNPTLSWYDLPVEVKHLLIAAANTWEDTAQSQDYIQQALAIADQSLDVLVAAYRYFFGVADFWDEFLFERGAERPSQIKIHPSIKQCHFFYKHNDTAALPIAAQVIAQIKQTEGLPDDWQMLAPILNQRKEEANIRLYLNAYAASGLILARMGDIEQATMITTRINEIDDKREFGAATLLHILTHPEEEE